MVCQGASRCILIHVDSLEDQYISWLIGPLSLHSSCFCPRSHPQGVLSKKKSVRKMAISKGRETSVKDNWKCILICLAMSLANCQYGYAFPPPFSLKLSSMGLMKTEL